MLLVVVVGDRDGDEVPAGDATGAQSDTGCGARTLRCP
jgi:hypothetical protein